MPQESLQLCTRKNLHLTVSISPDTMASPVEVFKFLDIQSAARQHLSHSGSARAIIRTSELSQNTATCQKINSLSHKFSLKQIQKPTPPKPMPKHIAFSARYFSLYFKVYPG